MKAWVLGQFSSSDALLDAGRQLRTLGHSDLDAYSPYPLHGIEEALALPKSRVPLMVLCAALIGASSGYLLQWWCNVISYPINVGGRPLHSPWTNVPITFELGVLISGLTAFFGLFALLGLPRLHHPVFEAESFRRASIDRYFLSVGAASDEEREKISAELTRLGAEETSVVEERR